MLTGAGSALGRGPQKPGRLPLLALLVLSLTTAWWIWGLLCAFPSSEWNNIRLRPAFLLATGHTLYEGTNGGPITTWMYGPVLPVLLLPATLAGSVETALRAASFLNAGIVLAVPALVAWGWPGPLGRRERWLAFLASTLAMSASAFTFLNADTAAVTLSLLGMFSLLRAEEKGPRWLWLAAAFAIAAAASKQLAVGTVVAQVIYLGRENSPRAALHHLGRGFVFAALGAGLAAGCFGFEAAWLKMVVIPAKLPFAPDLLLMTRRLAPYLLIYAGMLLLLVRAARQAGPALRLALLNGVCALPLGLAASLREGGSINSLHGYWLMLPFCLFWLLERFVNRRGQGAAPGDRSLLTAVAVVALLASFRWVAASQAPHQPAIEALREADILARRFPGEIWFPWSPLVTFYADGRHDHDEDGLFVRQVSGIFPRKAVAYRHLPPKWRFTAFRNRGVDKMNWGIAGAMHSNAARLETFGHWTLVISPPPPPDNR